MITLDLLKTANLISESEHKNPSKTTLDLIENISNDVVTKWMVRDLPDKFNGIFQILPGVNNLLSKLNSDDSFQLALLTGNYAVNANLKLIAAGVQNNIFKQNGSDSISELFADYSVDPREPDAGNFHGSFGSDHYVRRKLPPIAVERFQKISKEPFETIIIGDTPLDVDCAHFNNLKCVAVATGKFTSDELKNFSPELLLEDFSDTDKVLEQLKNL